MARTKYYVVWIGAEPGIYNSWEECRAQVGSWKGAVYKSFDTLEQARQAFAGRPDDYISVRKPAAPAKRTKKPRQLPSEVIRQSLAVDAACSGNPGMMEYRGIWIEKMQQVFHYGPVLGTNNIGEFLAIVHGLSLLRQKNLGWPIYSDSRNAILWVKSGKCRTRLPRTPQTEQLFQVIRRAESWLEENRGFTNPILKWDTRKWGEIPADFGRK